MDFNRLQKNWTNLGKRDPLWAILSDESARGGGWDLEEFLQSGRGFIDYIERHVMALGLQVRLDRALDFGCGYGRLTQALAGRFAAVTGVDIAESMIEGARSIDRTAGRCTFVHNTSPDLSRFADGSFDFVLTALVLQHMRPEFALGYVAEFARVLRPGGVCVFQMPTEPLAAVTPPGVRTPAPAALSYGELAGAVTVHPAQLTLPARHWRWLRVHVANLGAVALRAGDGPGKVQVATRWQDAFGAPLTPARLHDLPRDVAPGEVVRMLAVERAPMFDGTPLLAAHLEQGGHWVESLQLGMARVATRVAIGAGDAPGAADRAPPRPGMPRGAHAGDDPDEAEIEVYGAVVGEVGAVIEAAGGQLVDVIEDAWAGPDWLSAHYTFVKR